METNVSNNSGLFDSIEQFLTSNYNFRYNSVKNQVEFRTTDSDAYKSMTDLDFNSILRALAGNRLKCSDKRLSTILNSNFVPSYDPIKMYLEQLPPWDGETDHIAILASTVNTTDDSSWSIYLKKYLIGMTASMVDGKVNDTMLIIAGQQGLGKSRWIRSLVPTELKEYYYSGPIDPGNKDSLIRLATCFLNDNDELDSLNRSEIGAFKRMITQASIKLRRPYGRADEDFPRRASFIGSVNSRKFLSDTTGSRRFLCVTAESIDYQHNIDISQVYAQAYALYKSGTPYWFNASEIAELNRNNESYRSISIVEESLLKFFEPGDEDSYTEFMSATDILQQLHEFNGIGFTDSNLKKLGKALQAHNFKHGIKYVKLNRYSIRGYFLTRKTMKLDNNDSQEAVA